MSYSPLAQFWRDNSELAARPRKAPGFYTIEWKPLAASAVQVQADVQVSMAFAFVAISASLAANDTTDTAVATQAFRLMLVNQSTSTNITNMKAGVGAILPFTQLTEFGAEPWPYPLLFAPGTNIVAQLDNTTATAVNVRLTFSGIKVF